MTVAQVNYLNIFLMALSGAAAFVIPFELFVGVYAILGPAHYLTEISWLHDRKYFTTGKYDYLFLVLPALLLTIITFRPAATETNWNALVLWLTFGSAFGMFYFKRQLPKLVLAFCLLLAGLYLLGFSPFCIFAAILLPTIIHVYLFTGAFILFGALKGRSFSGYLSFGVFLLIPALLLIVQPATGYSISPYIAEASSFFKSLTTALAKIFRLNEDWDSTVAIMRFIAFAYTYHYLNWFSKTKIIQWHAISRERLTVIASIYLLSLLLYFAHYGLGFVTLFFLSMLHVVLEFPLNFHSFSGIYAEINKRLRTSQP